MQLEIRAVAKQSNVISAQVIQSIRLLQYSQHELRDYLNEQAERNPFLEVRLPDAAVARDLAQQGRVTMDRPAATGSTVKFASGGASGQRLGGVASPGGRAPADAQTLEAYCAEPVTLRNHLLKQAAMTFRDPVDSMIAAGLIESLETDGYLRTDMAVLSDRMGADQERLETVLSRIQAFEPAGIAARDLAECLAIQLKERNRLDPAMTAMLCNLPLVANYEMARLARLCNVSAEDIAAMVQEIKALDPRPGNRFDNSPVQLALPDVLVMTAPDGGCTVELNSSLLPRVLVNRQYFASITRNRLGGDDRRFVMDSLKAASWVTKNLDQRAQTILKVATEIATRQGAFFQHGVEHLAPLCLKDVAKAVGIHESTVCRAIANKFIMTNRGLFEMRYFFSNSIGAVDGNKELSPETVRHKIGALIDGETADNVMSDEAIVIELRKIGVDIARRTIAKYRDIMNIPSSQQRRRKMRVEDLQYGRTA